MNPNRRRFLTISFILLVSLTAFSRANAKTEPQWQNGKLLDSNTETGSRLVGVNGNLHERRNDRTYYQIETDQFIYVVSRSLERRHDKPLNVTINGAIQFAIDGVNVLLKDDNGQEHKLTLEKKILKSTNTTENQK